MVRVSAGSKKMVDLGLSLQFLPGTVSDKGFFGVSVASDPAKAASLPSLRKTGRAEVRTLHRSPQHTVLASFSFPDVCYWN